MRIELRTEQRRRGDAHNSAMKEYKGQPKASHDKERGDKLGSINEPTVWTQVERKMRGNEVWGLRNGKMEGNLGPPLRSSPNFFTRMFGIGARM